VKLVQISKEIELDAGHRVPNHESKCRNPHGHRYKIIATCSGPIIEEPGAPDEGMLVDFSHLKKFLTEEVHDVLDHGFIVYEKDAVMLGRLGYNPDGQYEADWKIIIFPYIPTAENIARWAYDQIQPQVANHFRDNLVLEFITVWETPTSMAQYPA